MLAAIRERVHGIVAAVLLTFLIIPFALWGTYSYFDSGSDVNVAEVDGTKITQQVYRIALDRLLARDIDPAVLNNPEFKRQVLDGLVDQALIVQNGIAKGYRVGDEELARAIRTAPEFKREDRFDSELYTALLRREGLSEEAFEERLRSVRVNGQIQAGLIESALLLSAEKDAVVRLWQQRREFDYALIAPARFTQSVQISEDDIKERYTSQIQGFMTPEQVRIEYITLSVAALGRDYQPTEAELRRAYAEELARFSIPDKRRVSHILIELSTAASAEEQKQALDKARDIEKQLRAGADFAQLAKQHSADSGSAANGGDLGYVASGTFPPPLAAAVARIKAGEITEPVKTDYGYHVAKLTEYTPGSRKTFEEVRSEIETLLRQRKGEEQFYEKLERMSNLVYEHPDSLAPAAEALGIKITQSDWFEREGGSGIAAERKVVEAAFSHEVLLQARNSDALEIGRDKLVALRVVGHRKAAPKPLAEVSAEIRNILEDEQARAHAAKLTADIIEALRTGAAFNEIAQVNALKVEQADVSRIDPRNVNRGLVAAVFKARRPAAGEAVYGQADLGKDGYAVFALKAVNEDDPAKADESLRRRVENLLQQRRGTDLYAQYVARLRATADIKTHPDRL